jgi:light-regulated signal transduction histidine kinase (bacteriophytochrome)
MLANQKLNLLSSVTRHDILNKLTAVLGYLELARESASLGDVRNLVEMAGRAAVTMRRQIDFTRQYQDVGVRSPVWQDLRDVIAENQPMTVRQVFYQAVSRRLIEKTEAQYKNTVVRLLTDMRIAGVPYWCLFSVLGSSRMA